MATSAMSSSKCSSTSMGRTDQWVFSHEIPADIIVDVGDASFPVHKFMLVAKSGYMRRKILESSDQADLMRIGISEIPGGAETFEKAAKFCYGVNFEITIHNVVALRCAAEYLEMTDELCEGNLAGRTEEFLNRAALKSLTSSVIVLKSCESFLPMAEELKIVRRCVDVVSLKVCNELNFPTRSPPEWWLNELMVLGPFSLQMTLAAMRSRGAAPKVLSVAVSTYAQKSLPSLFLSGAATLLEPDAADARTRQREILESIVSILPSDASFQVGFICCLLRAAIFLNASINCRKNLERRISAVLDQSSVSDLLAISLDYGGDRIADLDSVRRVLAGFVERESGGVLYGGGAVCCSAAMQRVAKNVDAFAGEIATDEDLSVSKFAGIARVLPKSARRFDDDLYRAVDIYLKGHPNLDEIEKEKVCSVMDPLRLSYEARLHASQNKRLPLQTVLHALYYDQLNLRSGTAEEPVATNASAIRSQLNGDVSLMKENETLRSELTRMKLYVSDMQRSGQSSSTKAPKKPSFFRSVTKTFGKINPFKINAGSLSKDTSNLDDGVDVTKPRRRRFSLS